MAQIQQTCFFCEKEFVAGRIDAKWILENTRDRGNTVYYTCGTNNLIDSMSALLAEAGVPKDHIVFEKWG